MILFLLHTIEISMLIVGLIAAVLAFLAGINEVIEYFGFTIALGCMILLLSAIIAATTS